MLPTPMSGREEARRAAREKRNARRLWRREMLGRVAGGESRQQIAAEQGVSISALQRALKRAAAELPRENRSIHDALQAERVRRALRMVDAAIAAGDLNAVYAMARLLPLLQAYEIFEPGRHDFAWSEV